MNLCNETFDLNYFIRRKKEGSELLVNPKLQAILDIFQLKLSLNEA